MQDVIDFVEKSFKDSIEDAVDRIKNETVKGIENIKRCKNDRDRVGSLELLLLEAVNIFITAKENFEAELLKTLNNNTLSYVSGYNKLLNDAIDCLLKKEELNNSLEDIDKRIKTNENHLLDLDIYYQGKKK